MDKLRDELIEMSELFDSCNITEEKQRDIIIHGVYFGFDGGWGDHVTLNCFQFAKFLRMCKSLNSDFDVNKMFRDLRENHDDNYRHIVDFFIKEENRKKEQQKTL